MENRLQAISQVDDSWPGLLSECPNYSGLYVGDGFAEDIRKSFRANLERYEAQRGELFKLMMACISNEHET